MKERSREKNVLHNSYIKSLLVRFFIGEPEEEEEEVFTNIYIHIHKYEDT